MTWKEYFKENQDKMPKEFADKEITVDDCLKIIDGMSFIIKELFDKKKWHTGEPTESGLYLVVLDSHMEEPFYVLVNYYPNHEKRKWQGNINPIAWQKIEQYKA